MPQLAHRHVALTVRDLDKSERWYCDLFDLEVVRREESDTRQAVVLIGGAGGMRIGLVHHKETGDAAFDPHVAGLDHTGWAVESRDDLDEWEALFRANGVEHTPTIDVGGHAVLNFKDPDRIAHAIFWDSPTG